MTIYERSTVVFSELSLLFIIIELMLTELFASLSFFPLKLAILSRISIASSSLPSYKSILGDSGRYKLPIIAIKLKTKTMQK